MRVGMSLPFGGDLAGSARRIEDAGFDGAWVFDAINRGFPLPDPLMALAVAGSVTHSIELGTCVLQLGLRPPAELAARVMTAHLVCGSRLSIGVGAGSTEADFRACGVDFAERRQRFDTALDVIPRLLAGEEVDGVALTPWPATLGGPRVLIGTWARGDLIRRAANEFDGWIASAAKGGRLPEGIARYRAAGGRRALVTNITVDLTGPDTPPDPAAPFTLHCSPRQARDRLKWLADQGYDDVILRTTNYDKRNLATIRALH
jgi:alkanesulfonate monooxygenase SsuD/methylene tetrahydromethanopterin reductase-like flavin-dependent oxidoreductase (luciferase family)